ncbi:MAG: hypothetical protein LBC62_01395, partial [Treponema sp.]|nr:hypothetical protein [Treponema sp.]
LLAAQTEVLFTTENLKVEGTKPIYSPYYPFNQISSYTYKEKYSGKNIQVPLMLKLDFHLGRFMLQPEAGIYLNITLGDLDYEYQSSYNGSYKDQKEYRNPLFGMMFGGALGFRIGRGYIFADTRYAVNFGKTEIEGEKVWKKSNLMVNFGYQHYFKSKQ